MENAAVPRPARARTPSGSPTRPRAAGVDAPVPSCPGWTVDRPARALRGRRPVGADDRRARAAGQHRRATEPADPSLRRAPRWSSAFRAGAQALRRRPRRRPTRAPRCGRSRRPTAPPRSGTGGAPRRPRCTATTPSSRRARPRRSTPSWRSTASTRSSPCSCPAWPTTSSRSATAPCTCTAPTSTASGCSPDATARSPVTARARQGRRRRARHRVRPVAVPLGSGARRRSSRCSATPTLLDRFASAMRGQTRPQRLGARARIVVAHRRRPRPRIDGAVVVTPLAA